jgi:inhibitor of cysteine peptidase
MRILLVMLAMLLAACISGDDDAGTDGALTVTEADAGGNFEVEEGETIIVELDSNPTTGYEWAVDELSPAVLTYTGSEYEPEDDDVVGGGGIQRLSFQAANPGRATLELKYWRSWEGDRSVDRSYEVTVDVIPSE